ncbi:MAG: TerY-C metal binding domain-containing protein [Pseudomonadota bacterium]
MRRLPIYMMLDVSESMAGDNLRQLQQGLDQLVSSLRTDPHALETVFLSTIVFAGKARTLSPLTELATYYPPRLPVGSGTSLGAALIHLMDEIERSVVKTTTEQKGDWRPVVYLMTDGKPTDDIEPALKRWNEDFAKRVTLVAIGVGKYAALETLTRFTENVILLDAANDEDFKRFVDWVSKSVVAQSRSVAMAPVAGVNLAKLDESILKRINEMETAINVDEDLVVLTGKCTNNKLPYLMKYEKMAPLVNRPGIQLNVAVYNLSGVYALEGDYYALSDERAMIRTVHTDSLIGSPGCPHCGNPIGFAMCSCGQVMCIRGEGPATCPTCAKECNFVSGGDDDGFDVARSRG